MITYERAKIIGKAQSVSRFKHLPQHSWYTNPQRKKASICLNFPDAPNKTPNGYAEPTWHLLQVPQPQSTASGNRLSFLLAVDGIESTIESRNRIESGSNLIDRLDT